MASIDEARLEVQAAFAKVLSTADTVAPRAFAVVEALLWTQVLALGHALVVLYLARQAGRPRRHPSPAPAPVPRRSHATRGKSSAAGVANGGPVR